MFTSPDTFTSAIDENDLKKPRSQYNKTICGSTNPSSLQTSRRSSPMNFIKVNKKRAIADRRNTYI